MSKGNERQLAAAAHGEGHALVLAGPGTGKTSTLVARHARLVSRGVDPSCIWISTFTQKAADEIRSRIGARAGPRAWIGTFHGNCTRLLRRFHAEFDIPKNFRILDSAGAYSLIAGLRLRWDSDDGDLPDIIGRWKDDLVGPEDALRTASSPIMVTAADHYAAYERERLARGQLDFADLVTTAMRGIRDIPVVGDFVAERFPFALVDEFQDVNRAQAELLSAKARRGTRIWAVADDDQALYGWRGAKVEYTLDFRDRFEGATVYTLGTVYRCSPAVLAAASTLVAHNRKRLPKKLTAARPHVPGNIVTIRQLPTDVAEAEWIGDAILRLRSKGLEPSRMAVLGRTSSVLAHVQRALEKRAIPFSISGSSGFWSLPEVAAVAELVSAVEAADTTRPICRRFRGAVDLVETMRSSGPAETASAAGRIVARQPPAGVSGERAASWADAAETAASAAAGYADAPSFEAARLRMEAEAAGGSSEGVALATIHSSKGLEWSHVFIAGAEKGLMPHRRNEDVEEERRLLYVALTRSKGAVDVTLSKTRFGRSTGASPFLAELAKAPPGAVRFEGTGRSDGVDDQQDRPKAPARAAKRVGTMRGGRAIYRRGGGKSLIGDDD